MSVVFDNMHYFVAGLSLTLQLTLISGVIALLAGLVVTTMRVSPVPAFRGAAMVYVEIVRNTPITIVFFFAAFVLPQLGVRLPYFTFAVIALSVYYTAFFAEALRSGFNSVAVGQAEAARSIGLTFSGVLFLVVLPQALRSSVPPLINVVIALVKSTAVASAFGVPELLTQMEHLANAESNAVLMILAATACIYLLITIPAGILATHIERKVAFAR